MVGGGAFYGGMKYAQGKNSRGSFANLTSEQRQQLGANIGGQGGFRGGQGGGAVAGDIISKDSQSITVKMRDGSSKIVFFSDTTEVSKFVAGTSADLAVGKTIIVMGKTNSDGSVTATTIQFRPNLPSLPIPSK